jgi:hypothetical protein
MNPIKIKNMIIDALFPLIFWGGIYLTAPIIGYWTWEAYISWYLLMVVFTPMNILGGRAVNTWRRLLKYDYKGYS